MSSMANFSSWALLLLTMFPLFAAAGRHLPAGPPAAASLRRSTPDQVQLPAALAAGNDVDLVGGALGYGRQFQDMSPAPHRKNLRGVKAGVGRSDSIYGHRLLVGSSPPTCQGKCGSCNPCSPIHVSIGSPHGALTQQEYYPEVWRCKCGNRLFMP